MICTETWIRPGDRTEEFLQDLSSNTKYEVLRRDREGRRGGGIAVIYRKDRIEMSIVKIPKTEYEIMATIGRRPSQRKKILTIAAYFPPSLDTENTNKFLGAR